MTEHSSLQIARANHIRTDAFELQCKGHKRYVAMPNRSRNQAAGRHHDLPLADAFASAHATRIDWDGKPTHAIFEIAPAPGGVIVDFLAMTHTPVQGLALRAAGGHLLVDGITATEMVLWSDTAPPRVHLGVEREAGKQVTLKFWNVWRGRMGGMGGMGGIDVTHAWLGNAGMRVERSQDGRAILLRCSDGEGAVDFGNLEVCVTLA